MSKRWGMWFVYRCLIDGGRDGLWWPASSGNWLFCIGCWPNLHTMKWLMYGILFFTYSPPYYISFHGISFSKKRIKQVTRDILSIRFTYYAKDNHQGCSRLSNWFSLWCFGPCMNHFPPLWWFTFKFKFLNVSWCISLVWWRGIFYWFVCFHSCFGH